MSKRNDPAKSLRLKNFLVSEGLATLTEDNRGSLTEEGVTMLVIILCQFHGDARRSLHGLIDDCFEGLDHQGVFREGGDN